MRRENLRKLIVLKTKEKKGKERKQIRQKKTL